MTRKHIRTSLNVVVAGAGILLSYSAHAENHLTTYKYGTKLDIVKVLSISTQVSHVCKPVDHIMRYIDSSGKTQALKYRALSDSCGKRR